MREKKLRPGYCIAAVKSAGMVFVYHQCRNKAKIDGFCSIHHPDAVKKRQLEKDEREQKRWEASPFQQLLKKSREVGALKETIRQQDKIIEKLRKEIEGLKS
jgi:predicted RNA-binding protein with PUA-like domain